MKTGFIILGVCFALLLVCGICHLIDKYNHDKWLKQRMRDIELEHFD